jgi:tRNA modification GTPase
VQGEIVITNSRHFENLNSAFDNMKRVRGMIQSQASPELLSLEMKEALLRVQETVGKRFDDQILDRVFKEFCIGK